MSNIIKAPFFSDPKNIDDLQLFLRELDWVGANSIEPEGLVNHLKSIIKLIISKPKDFDESAVSNIEWIGRDFMNLVAEFRRIPEEEKEEQLNSLFTSGYGFLCELQFVQGGDLSFELRQVTNFVHDNLDKFNSGDKQQLIFSCYTMPAKIAARLLRHPDIGEFKNLSEKLEAVKSL
ncbi:hypothetical protein AVKW3434_22310 [Acidovorax sp. SUPP3434]|uniref:hypothetical protein n=1 Tax=Acidovorax sp. SUPP3434 TaxID=2920880 RepID=UPI0023DE2072|nr:hypothetical protein [Acidovorax sp. SUPP3434]GKT02173.1 hypothetical protein AVKW3434_22310 [Acidovorax sp. SUPP3434]